MNKRGRPALSAGIQSEPFTVRLPLPMYDALMLRATEQNVPVRQLVREALDFVLNNRVPAQPSGQ